MSVSRPRLRWVALAASVAVITLLSMQSHASGSSGSLEGYVIFAEDEILMIGGEVASGDLGVQTDSGPQAELRLQNGATVTGSGSTVRADQVQLLSPSTVVNAHYNSLSGSGVQGTHTTPLALPVLPSMPSAPPASPGTADVVVLSGQSTSLAPGQYDELTTQPNATVTLTGGEYHFTSWDLGSGTTIEASAAVDVRLSENLDGDSGIILGPASGTSLGAPDIAIAVHGAGGPPNGGATITGTVTATIHVPNAQLKLTNGTFTGQFIGKTVRVGAATFNLDTSTASDAPNGLSARTPPTVGRLPKEGSSPAPAIWLCICR